MSNINHQPPTGGVQRGRELYRAMHPRTTPTPARKITEPQRQAGQPAGGTIAAGRALYHRMPRAL